MRLACCLSYRYPAAPEGGLGPSLWQYGDMAKVKTTVSIDEGLMREVRVRAARTGRRDSEVLEAALREGLGIIDRIRAKTNLGEAAAYQLAREAVKEARRERRSGRSAQGSNKA